MPEMYEERGGGAKRLHQELYSIGRTIHSSHCWLLKSVDGTAVHMVDADVEPQKPKPRIIQNRPPSELPRLFTIHQNMKATAVARAPNSFMNFELKDCDT